MLLCHGSVLRSRGLRGWLPDKGWTLPSLLRDLDLYNNSLTGSMPPSFSIIAPSLTTLNLACEHLHRTDDHTLAIIFNSRLITLPPSLCGIVHFNALHTRFARHKSCRSACTPSLQVTA